MVLISSSSIRKLPIDNTGLFFLEKKKERFRECEIKIIAHEAINIKRHVIT